MFLISWFRRADRWRAALSPDVDLAEAEGLAAGTGLLTGTVARSVTGSRPRCPECQGSSDVVVVDLVARSTSLRCTSCSHRWTLEDLPAVAPRR